MDTNKRHSQSWHPERYARHARFVSDHGESLLTLLEPKPGERILDIGCGDGVLTRKIADSGATVVAIDASPEQVAGARAAGLDAHVADGEALAFEEEFDAVFSNAALHWMKDADAVIDGMWRALKPGGRIVVEMGGGHNVATIAEALIAALESRGIEGRAAHPWYFPSVEQQRALLESRGFRVISIELFERPTPLPGEMDGWLETFGESFLTQVPPAERPALIAEVTEALRPQLCGPDGKWTADYVRLRFVAVKPG
jgi:trans-aconitate methyltransferase